VKLELEGSTKILGLTKKIEFLLNTVHDLKLSHLFQKKSSKKCDNLGTFTQKVPFLDYNKSKKKEKSVTIWKKSVTIWKKKV